MLGCTSREDSLPVAGAVVFCLVVWQGGKGQDLLVVDNGYGTAAA